MKAVKFRLIPVSGSGKEKFIFGGSREEVERRLGERQSLRYIIEPCHDKK